MTSRKSKPPSLLDDSVLAVPDARSLVREDNESILSATTFEFDNIIVNSHIYREASRKHQAATRPKHDPEIRQHTPGLKQVLPNPRDPTRDFRSVAYDNSSSPVQSDSESDSSPADGSSKWLRRAVSFESVGTVKANQALQPPIDKMEVAQASESMIGNEKIVPSKRQGLATSAPPFSKINVAAESEYNTNKQKSKPLAMAQTR